jgi:hypothetical protein
LNLTVPLWQFVHLHPLYNPWGAGIQDTREYAIRLLSRYIGGADTASILAAEGVKYVVLHDDVYRADHMAPPITLPELRLIRRFADVRVFRLSTTTVPADLGRLLDQHAAEVASIEGLRPPNVSLGLGFSAPPPGSIQRTMTRSGAIELFNSDPALKRVLLSFTGETANGYTNVTAHDATGAVVGRVHVGPLPANSVVGLVNVGPGETTIRLVVDDGRPIRVSDVAALPLADYSVSLRDIG